VYITESVAEDALIDAHERNHYGHRGPVAVYRCEECGYYHFTSKGQMNERLAKLLASGKINLHRQANEWMNRLKK